jgi:uncharacterized protein (TIRG00374 family)
MRLTRSRTALLVAQALFGIALLLAWARLIDLHALGQVLAHASWTFVVAGAGISLAAGVLRAQRWRLLLRPLVSVGLVDVWLIALASNLINFLVPIRSGELARVVLLKQRRGTSMAASLPTVFVDRSFDLMAVLALGTSGALMGVRIAGRGSEVMAAGAALLLAFLAFIIAVAAFRERFIGIFGRLLSRLLGERSRDWLLGLADRFLGGFAAVRHRPRDLAAMAALSLCASLLDAAAFAMMFIALGRMYPPSLIVAGFALFALTFLVPSAPGYVGSMEAFGSLVFTGLGVPSQVAAGAVVLYHALNVLVLGATGAPALWAVGLRSGATWRASLQLADDGTPSGPAEPRSGQ